MQVLTRFFSSCDPFTQTPGVPVHKHEILLNGSFYASLAWIRVMLSPFSMILPSCFSVCRLVCTSEASSSTRFMYSSNPVMWPSILKQEFYRVVWTFCTLCWRSRRARRRPWFCSGGIWRWGWWAAPSPSAPFDCFHSSSWQSGGISLKWSNWQSHYFHYNWCIFVSHINRVGT